MEIKAKSFNNYKALILVTTVFFTVLAFAMWAIEGKIFLFINFIYIGLFTTLGIILFATLSFKKKNIGRKVSLFAVGFMLFIGAGVMGRMNMQLEGFFFYLFAGFYSGTVLHYLVAKIFGPIVIGRSWCGWGCWTMTILDLLPYKKSSGRINLGWIRYAHFVLGLLLVLILWFGFNYSISRKNWDIIRGMYWFLGGNAVYYLAAIILAVKLKDNRAFCKYLCPITTFLKPASKFSLVKIKGDEELCSDCKACSKACPMDIDVSSYAKESKKVTSTECILCLNCVSVCPKRALQSNFSF